MTLSADRMAEALPDPPEWRREVWRTWVAAMALLVLALCTALVAFAGAASPWLADRVIRESPLETLTLGPRSALPSQLPLVLPCRGGVCEVRWGAEDSFRPSVAVYCRGEYVWPLDGSERALLLRAAGRSGVIWASSDGRRLVTLMMKRGFDFLQPGRRFPSEGIAYLHSPGAYEPEVLWRSPQVPHDGTVTLEVRFSEAAETLDLLPRNAPPRRIDIASGRVGAPQTWVPTRFASRWRRACLAAALALLLAAAWMGWRAWTGAKPIAVPSLVALGVAVAVGGVSWSW